MNAIAVLRKEHREISYLIDEVRRSGDGQVAMSTETKELLKRLSLELTSHILAEVEVFYPAMAQFHEAQGIADRAMIGQAELKTILNELLQIARQGSDHRRKLSELQFSFKRHIYEEEKQLFPRAEKLSTRAELEGWGNEMLEVQERNSRTDLQAGVRH
jgi:hemerythrin superfamily protein